ncbi:MAG: hypothetical protein RIQ81_156 [Pseudomonadota bacterium]|jgi:uncharacterized protein YaaW (UPF0174 family)
MSAKNLQNHNNATIASFSMQQILVRNSLQAVWLDSDDDLKHHLLKLCGEISKHYGKQYLDLSIEDLHHLVSLAYKLSKSAGFSRVTANDISRLLNKIQSLKKSTDPFADIYRITELAQNANLIPLATKALVSIATPRIRRASIVYFSGMIIHELYRDKPTTENSTAENISEATYQEDDFDPLFSCFDRSHLASLCCLLNVRADINADDAELKNLIKNEFSYYTRNFFSHLYNKASSGRCCYGDVLAAICEDLKIDWSPGQSAPLLEEKIVAAVLRETLDTLSKTEREKLIARLKTVQPRGFDLQAIATSGSLATILLGNFSGFGTYIAASSALSAITSGLGISAGFTVYTSMSSAMGVLFGPIGMTASAAAFALSLSKSTPRRAIPAVLYIAAMRAKLETRPPKFSFRDQYSKIALVVLLCLSCATLGYLAHMIFANFGR